MKNVQFCCIPAHIRIHGHKGREYYSIQKDKTLEKYTNRKQETIWSVRTQKTKQHYFSWISQIQTNMIWKCKQKAKHVLINSRKLRWK